MSYVYFTPPEKFESVFEVAAVFCQIEDKVLLLQINNKKRYANKWCVPGGKIEAEENVVDGLIREFLEETNIELSKDKVEFVKKVYIRYPEVEFEHNIFKVSLSKIPTSFKISQEHQGAKWVTKKEAMNMDLTPGEYECFEIAYPNE